MTGLDPKPQLLAVARERAAGELVRVSRPGGAIGVCSWTPDAVGGRVHAAVAKRLEADAPPTLWGSEEQLRELLGGPAKDINVEAVARL